MDSERNVPYWENEGWLVLNIWDYPAANSMLNGYPQPRISRLTLSYNQGQFITKSNAIKE